MAKSDLAARPIYHRKQDSIEAHLTIVFAALAGASGSIGEIVGFRAGWGLGNALFVATALSTIVVALNAQLLRRLDLHPQAAVERVRSQR